jgi:hypothetical protein
MRRRGGLSVKVPRSTTMAKHVSATLGEYAKVWGLLAVVALVGFVATYQYVGAPPRSRPVGAVGGGLTIQPEIDPRKPWRV